MRHDFSNLRRDRVYMLVKVAWLLSASQFVDPTHVFGRVGEQTHGA